MAFTKQQLDFLRKYFNFDKQKSVGKSTEEAAKAVFGEAQESPERLSKPAPGAFVPSERSMEEAANAWFGESQASPFDPLQLRAINDRMKQVAEKKFPTALGGQKAHSLQKAEGLVESGKLAEANKLLDALEKAASKFGAGALQGEKYAMKSMGDNYIREEKNAPPEHMGAVNFGGIPRETRRTPMARATPYMTPEQTEASEVTVEGSDAGTKLTQQGKAVTGENIFVMDGEGKIMAQSPKSPKRNSDKGEVDATDSQGRPVDPHHSNFLRGEAVAGAGELHTDDQGNLKKVTDQSGHYRPDAVHTQQVLESLEEQGANLNNVKFTASKTKTEGMAKEFQQGGTVKQFKRRHKVVDEIKEKSDEIKKKSGLLED